jgi:hypothetical protein
MSRLSAMSRNPKRTLSVLAVVLAATGVTIGSGASFTSSSSNPANTFTAGLLHHSNTATGHSLVSTTISNIKPGFGTSDGTAVDATSGSAGFGQVVINNDGNLPGDFTISQSESSFAYTGTTPLASAVCGGACSALDGALKVRVTKTDSSGGGEVTLYDNLVSGFATASLGSTTPGATFSLDAGTTRTYKAYFYMPISTGNAFQGGSATVGLSFAEIQQ